MQDRPPKNALTYAERVCLVLSALLVLAVLVFYLYDTHRSTDFAVTVSEAAQQQSADALSQDLGEALGAAADAAGTDGAAQETDGGETAAAVPTPSADDPLNINTADAAALALLPGVSKSLAAAIVAYREANGAFLRASDVRLVSGVSDSIYRAIHNLITV